MLPSATATSTLTPIQTSTPTPTFTVTPITQVNAVMSGNVYVRAEPNAASARGPVVLRNTQVHILAIYGDWAKISWTDQFSHISEGWVPTMWVGAIEAIPAQIITPTHTPSSTP